MLYLDKINNITKTKLSIKSDTLVFEVLQDKIWNKYFTKSGDEKFFEEIYNKIPLHGENLQQAILEIF